MCAERRAGGTLPHHVQSSSSSANGAVGGSEEQNLGGGLSDIAGKKALRIRGKSEKGGGHGGGVGVVETGFPRQLQHSADQGGGVDGGSSLAGLRAAARDLEEMVVMEGQHAGQTAAAALGDRGFVDKASRWRGGTAERQQLTAWAKVMKIWQGLTSVQPAPAPAAAGSIADARAVIPAQL